MTFTQLAAQQAGRPPEAVTLIAVSKTFDGPDIVPVIEAGQRVFVENRVQEAQGKYPALKAEYPALRLHLIGPLQSNKARDAVRLFDAIETVDRPKLAAALAAEMEREGRRPDCFIQVNTGEEAQKAGILPREADAFIETCLREHKLPVVGLMCIPPVDDPPAPHFALLREMARRHDLSQLSMGMSADFEDAIRFRSVTRRTVLHVQRRSESSQLFCRRARDLTRRLVKNGVIAVLDDIAVLVLRHD